jgi:hypothetical protein
MRHATRFFRVTTAASTRPPPQSTARQSPTSNEAGSAAAAGLMARGARTGFARSRMKRASVTHGIEVGIVDVAREVIVENALAPAAHARRLYQMRE